MRLGNYEITTDSRNFIVEKHIVSVTGKYKGKPVKQFVGYFGKLSQAIERISDDIVLQNFPDVQKILAELYLIKKEVKEWKGDLVFVLEKIEIVEG